MRPLLLITLLSLLTTTAHADNTNASFGANASLELVPTAELENAELTSIVPVATPSTETVTTRAVPVSKTRTINISTPDRFGTIEESLTPAIHSEARYVSRGGSSYLLVSTGQQRTSEPKEQLMIPSWKIFSW